MGQQSGYRVALAVVLVVVIGTALWFAAPVKSTADTLNSEGFVQTAGGEYDEAVATFTKAIELNPGYAKAYYNRGSIYDKMGELDKAIVDYRKTISLDPYYYEAHYFLDQALKKTGQADKRTR